MPSREVPPDYLASKASLLSNGTWMSPFAMLCQVSPRGVSGGVPKPCSYPGRRAWGTTFLADEPGVELFARVVLFQSLSGAATESAKMRAFGSGPVTSNQNGDDRCCEAGQRECNLLFRHCVCLLHARPR